MLTRDVATVNDHGSTVNELADCHRGCERITKLFRWAHSPPREEGWTRHQENDAKPPLMERTGWSLTSHGSRTHSATSFVSDHPVWRTKVASRLSYGPRSLPSSKRRGIRLREHAGQFLHAFID